MYVGVLLAIFGQALWFGSVATLWYALAIALMFHLMVGFYEEPTLRGKFGESYAAYCKTVPRWIPKPAAKLAPAKGPSPIPNPAAPPPACPPTRKGTRAAR